MTNQGSRAPAKQALAADSAPPWWPTAEQKAHADAGCAHPDECNVAGRRGAAGRIVCGGDAVQRAVVRRDGWWVVVLQADHRETLSGGFKRESDAIAEARRLGATA